MLLSVGIAEASRDEIKQAATARLSLPKRAVKTLGDVFVPIKDKKIADEVYAQTQKGADFAELAKKYGTDGTKDKGGSLGTFGKGEMIPAFEKKVFSMKNGEISKLRNCSDLR